MKIFVTGGLGTVGAGLVTGLTERGCRVISCDLYHQPDQYAFSLRNDLEKPGYVRCDIAEYRQLERVMKVFGPFDFVFNCAAEFGRWNGEDYYEQLWRSNVIGTKNIIRLQEDLGFRLVHFSSSEVYGDWPELMVETVMDEYAAPQLNDYAMSKWTNEMQIRNSARLFGTESVVVRLFNTYGPGEYYNPYRSVNCRFIYCALKGIPWVVYRGHKRTSTYLADAVNSLCNVVDNFIAGEVYNLGGGNLHSIEELSDTVLKVTGADTGLVSYEESEVLTTKIKRVDTSKAERDLGHQSNHSLEEGIQLTADWMREIYLLDGNK